jgi:carbon storage regulator
MDEGGIQGGTGMLVLSRKRGERIVIPGCSVTLTVVAVEGNRVRLGVAAPPEVAVVREELVRRRKARRGGRD